MLNSSNFFDFVNNENPYAFLRHYELHSFKKEGIKSKLDAIQKMQPLFIPCSMDDSIFKKERTAMVNLVIKKGINENITMGISILDAHNIEHDINHYRLDTTASSIDLVDKMSNKSIANNDNLYLKDYKYNFEALNLILDTFKKNIELDGMEDIILNIFRFKIINKQKLLRTRVYTAIKESLDDETILNIGVPKKLIEEPTEEIKQFLKLNANNT